MYYICIDRAMKSGGLKIPSSREVAQMFNQQTGAMHAEIAALRADLKWMYVQGLLFKELPIEPELFLVSPKQPTVNKLLSNFEPDFVKVHPQERELEPSEVVDKAATAMRLVALKEIYHAHFCELPAPLARDFLVFQKLIQADEFCGFARSMADIGYLRCDPSLADCGGKVDRDLRLEPGRKFRSRDMYVELRALDYFSEDRLNPERRARRIQLKKKATEFVTGQQQE